MIKRNVMAGVLSLSLAVSGIAPTQAAAPEEDSSSHLSLFTRELVRQNGSLNRYQYVDESGEAIDFSEDSISSYTKKRAAVLPTSYDAREEQVVTSIKDQGVTGACWAFGAIKSLESSSIRKGITSAKDTDFSESHMAWYAYHGVSDSSNPLYRDANKAIPGYSIYDQGGYYIDSISILANWWGAAREEDAPYTAATDQEVYNMERSMASADESLRTKSVAHLINANVYDEADLAAKKQAILDNGSMSVSLYFDARNVYEKDGVYSVYQNFYDSDYANHTVTIVGWDDNFSSFRSMPSRGKGAWLIANSYGSEWGNEGYYWVSYYDTSLCEFVTYEADTTDNYDTNYQYDGAGFENGFIGEKENIIFSNVFTNTSSSPQKISAAAFYTLTDGQKYEIALYRNIRGKNPTNGDYVAGCTTQGTADYSGYHTIPLKDSIIVAPGETFSIVTTFFHQNNTIYVPVEGTGNSTDSMKSFGSQAEQSFIYDEYRSIWVDTTKYTVYEGASRLNVNNLCLKAFGNNVSQEEYDTQQKTYTASTPTQPPANPSGNNSGTGGNNNGGSGSGDYTYQPITNIMLKSKKITIGKKESVNFADIVTISPTSSTDYFNIVNNKPSVVDVNISDQDIITITGRKAGTAKITISTALGKAISKTLTVTVKKAPTSVKAKAGKKVLKKGKTTKIKVYLPKKSASYKIAYRSSNKKIATVNSKGVVKAKKKGTVKIKVKTYNGKTSTVKIRVK